MCEPKVPDKTERANEQKGAENNRTITGLGFITKLEYLGFGGKINQADRFGGYGLIETITGDLAGRVLGLALLGLELNREPVQYLCRPLRVTVSSAFTTCAVKVLPLATSCLLSLYSPIPATIRTGPPISAAKSMSIRFIIGRCALDLTPGVNPQEKAHLGRKSRRGSGCFCPMSV